MIGLAPLVKDFIDNIGAASELQSVVDIGTGASARVYTERPSDDAALPFIAIDIVSANAWNDGSVRGTDYLVQVSLYVARGEQGAARGILDVAKAQEIIRDMLDDRDGYFLDESPAEGASLELDFTDIRFQQRSASGAKLVLRQYQAATIVPDQSGRYLAATSRFRCLVGNAKGA